MFDNHVTLIGNLGLDVEIKDTKTGISYTHNRVAVSKSYTASNGDFKKDTQWFRIVGWSNTATKMGENLTKGDRVLLEGRLVNRSYTDAKGVARQVTEINVSSFQKLARKQQQAIAV